MLLPVKVVTNKGCGGNNRVTALRYVVPMNTNYSYLQLGAKTILLSLSIVTLIHIAPAARAQSASDLMEQGIYSEDTKGDLNGAEQLYQKVITQAKEDRALAARAQYHLGVCYYKQNDFTNADVAFKAVVKDYPDQTNIVVSARKYLAAAHPLEPAPWSDGEDLLLDVELPTGLKIGVADYRVDSGVTINGEKTWRFSSHLVASIVQSASHVVADADTLAPIRSSWRHSLLGKVDATYYPDHVDFITEAKPGTNTVHFDVPVIDNEEAVEWMRRLPMTNGYSSDQSVFSSLVATIVPIKWDVSGPEQIQVPAGTFQCYKVSLSIAQTFWYSADANRYIVRFEGGGAVAELRSISHHRSDEMPTYADPTNGFSVSGPPGWIFAPIDSDKKNVSNIRFIDPEGVSLSELTVRPTESGAPTNELSLRNYITNKLADAAQIYGGFKVRANSWKDRTIAGQAGKSVIADYTEGKNAKVGYGIWSFGKTNEIYFQMITAEKYFDALQPKFEAIVNSYTQ